MIFCIITVFVAEDVEPVDEMRKSDTFLGFELLHCRSNKTEENSALLFVDCTVTWWKV